MYLQNYDTNICTVGPTSRPLSTVSYLVEEELDPDKLPRVG